MRHHRSSRQFPIMEHLESRTLFSIGVPQSMIIPPIPGIGQAPAIVASVNAAILDSRSILFNEAPLAVQTGLTTLAATEGLTAPGDSDRILLGNDDGLQTYSMILRDTFNVRQCITVDLAGAEVLPPTRLNINYIDLANPLVTASFERIAAALNRAAPADSDRVVVTTASAGDVTYSMNLYRTRSNGRRFGGICFTVNDQGDPVGNVNLPLSAFSTTIQDALIANTPAGATALRPTSQIAVRTNFAATTYSANFRSFGIRTTVTVDALGNLADLPSIDYLYYGDIPAAAQTALQTLATNRGFEGTIDEGARITALDQANGTVLYSFRFWTTTTNFFGRTREIPVTLTVDNLGNPTVLPWFSFRFNW